MSLPTADEIPTLRTIIRQCCEKLATLKSRRPYDERSAAFYVDRREACYREIAAIGRRAALAA